MTPEQPAADTATTESESAASSPRTPDPDAPDAPDAPAAPDAPDAPPESLAPLVHAWPEPSVLTTLEGTLVACADEARALLGASEDDPLGHSLADLVGTEAAAELLRPPGRVILPAKHGAGGRPTLLARSAQGVTGEVVISLSEALAESASPEQLAQAQRLASVGELLSSVAHELNNPLTSVLGYAELLITDPAAEPLRAELTSVRDEAARCRRIVQNLLDLARAESLETRPLLLRDVVAKVLEFRAYAAQVAGVELTADVPDDLPFVLGDFHRLVQAVLNLVTNAEQAVSGRDNPRVGVRALQRGARVVLEVEDNGSGVDPRHADDIFRPFFTTKPRGRGTGLGLSLVKDTAVAHGGTARVERADTGGARFVIELPVAGD